MLADWGCEASDDAGTLVRNIVDGGDDLRSLPFPLFPSNLLCTNKRNERGTFPCCAPESTGQCNASRHAAYYRGTLPSPSRCALPATCYLHPPQVIKVEPPSGDSFRYTMANAVGREMPNDYLNSPAFYAINRGKRSCVLDFKDPPQLVAFKQLLSTADIFVTNMRQSALVQYGIDTEAVHAAFPQLASENQIKTPFLPRICSRTLRGGRSNRPIEEGVKEGRWGKATHPRLVGARWPPSLAFR